MLCFGSVRPCPRSPAPAQKRGTRWRNDAGSLPANAAGNPFASGAPFYVNSEYRQCIESDLASRWARGHAQAQMESMMSSASAFWVDRISKIRKATSPDVSLESIMQEAASRTIPPLVVAILCARSRDIGHALLTLFDRHEPPHPAKLLYQLVTPSHHQSVPGHDLLRR